MTFVNRVTRLLGVDIPILQAPMGYIAKPPLVATVSEAGAMGLVPGSPGIDEVRDDIRRTRDLTDKPFGLNLPLAFLKDLAIVEHDRGPGHHRRDDVRGFALDARRAPEGCRADRVPRRPVAARRARGRGVRLSTGWWSRAARAPVSRARAR
jgi:NAD(P)H-dependent flavin oxidoreductase YrpB (nitropropane dioxygenase family)